MSCLVRCHEDVNIEGMRKLFYFQIQKKWFDCDRDYCCDSTLFRNDKTIHSPKTAHATVELYAHYGIASVNCNSDYRWSIPSSPFPITFPDIDITFGYLFNRFLQRQFFFFGEFRKCFFDWRKTNEIANPPSQLTSE